VTADAVPGRLVASVGSNADCANAMVSKQDEDMIGLKISNINRSKVQGIFVYTILLLPSLVMAQEYLYTTNYPDTNTITITRYNGPDGVVHIPEAIDGKAVVAIGSWAFWYSGGGVTAVTIPSSVYLIEAHAFYSCVSLTNIFIPDSVMSIGAECFQYCEGLQNIVIGSNITQISMGLFSACINLRRATIGANVTNVDIYAFSYCPNLKGVYFSGDAPSADSTVFAESDNVHIYYLAEANGWGEVLADRLTSQWLPEVLPQRLEVGEEDVRFYIGWAAGKTVVVEACTNLMESDWIALETNTLVIGTEQFTDFSALNDRTRFYRVLSAQ